MRSAGRRPRGGVDVPEEQAARERRRRQAEDCADLVEVGSGPVQPRRTRRRTRSGGVGGRRRGGRSPGPSLDATEGGRPLRNRHATSGCGGRLQCLDLRLKGVAAAIAETTINQAADILAGAARPARVVLFGSYARGDAGADSDLDFLVIEPAVGDRRAEMVRLRNALRPLRVPADVLVASDAQVREWSTIPGSILYEALLEGKTLRDNR